MKKFFLILAAKIAGVAVACLTAFTAYSFLEEIGAFFSDLWFWSTDRWFYFLPISLIIGLIGLETKRLKMLNELSKDSRRCLLTYKQAKRTKIVSKILLLIGSIGVGFSLLLLINSLGLIKIFLIIFGAIILVPGVALLIIQLSIKKIIKKGLAILLVAFNFVIFLYYLDIFIFSWRPWITLVASLLAIIIYLIIKAVKKYQKAEKEKAERIQQENERKTIENLSLLTPIQLAESYLTAKQRREQLTAELNLSALSLALNRGRSLNADNLIKICKTIKFLTCSLDKEFLNLIITRCFESTPPVFNLIFVTRNPGAPFDSLPILFANCSFKEAAIEKYLSSGLEKNSCYNSVKREFKIPVFIGVINILFFAYDKNDDEEILKIIFKKIEGLLKFAADCLSDMHDENEIEKLKTVITNLAKKAKTKGIVVEHPEEPELFNQS